MRTPIVVLACAGLMALAACTSPASPTPGPSSVAGSTTASASPATTAGTARPTATTPPAPGGGSASAARAIVLAGESIAGRPLGRARLSTVEPMLVARLGEGEVGRVQLCESPGARAPISVVDHNWSGLAVRTTRLDGDTIVLGWRVDVDAVPDGVVLADRRPWTPTFAALGRSGLADIVTSDGYQHATLRREAITYSGRADADRPDTVTGGPLLVCA